MAAVWHPDKLEVVLTYADQRPGILFGSRVGHVEGKGRVRATGANREQTAMLECHPMSVPLGFLASPFREP